MLSEFTRQPVSIQKESTPGTDNAISESRNRLSHLTAGIADASAVARANTATVTWVVSRNLFCAEIAGRHDSIWPRIPLNTQTQYSSATKKAACAEQAAVRKGSGSRLKEKPRHLAISDLLNEPINCWVELCVRWQFAWCASGDHQIGFGIELIPPQPSRTERLFRQVRTQVMNETSREHQDSRGTHLSGTIATR